MDNFYDGISDSGKALRDLIWELTKELSGFVCYNLYNKAATHYLGGEVKVKHAVNIFNQGRHVDSLEMQLLNSYEAFEISCYTDSLGYYHTHFKRLMNMTQLDTFYWINLNKHQVTFNVLKRTN